MFSGKIIFLLLLLLEIKYFGKRSFTKSNDNGKILRTPLKKYVDFGVGEDPGSSKEKFHDPDHQIGNYAAKKGKSFGQRLKIKL